MRFGLFGVEELTQKEVAVFFRQINTMHILQGPI